MIDTFFKKNLVAILAGLVCLGVVGGYLFAFRMLHGMYEDLHVAQQELGELAENERVYDELAVLVADIAPEQEELAKYFLSVDNPTPLLSMIEELGQSAGVKVEVDSLTERTDTVEGDEESSFTSVGVVLSVSGPWASVYHLLRLFEHLPYVMLLDKVGFEESRNDGLIVWEGQIHMRVLTQ